MAKTIKETPTLKGKDSDRFSRKMAENAQKRASQDEYKRVMDNYNKIKSLKS